MLIIDIMTVKLSATFYSSQTAVSFPRHEAGDIFPICVYGCKAM